MQNNKNGLYETIAENYTDLDIVFSFDVGSFYRDGQDPDTEGTDEGNS